MSYVKDNDDVFLGFELASCRGIGSNARNAYSNGYEGNGDSTSHGFSFLGGRHVHRKTPAIMQGFGRARAPTRETIRRSAVAGPARRPSSCAKTDGRAAPV